MDMSWIGLVSTLLLICIKSTLSDPSLPNITVASASDNLCRKCPPGQGVARECLIDTSNNTVTEDTMCAECPKGTFNTHPTSDTNCTACMLCEEWYYEKTPCSIYTDTVCISCSTKAGRGNEDFLLKCERTTTTLSTTLITTKLMPSLKIETSSVTTEDAGSGEGSGGVDNTLDVTKGIGGETDGEFIPPVVKKTSNPLLQLPSDFTIPPTPPTFQDSEVAIESASTQVWWIILIILIALIGLFLMGVVIRKVKKRKSVNLNEKSPPPNSDEATVIEMNNTDGSKTPLKNGVNGTTSGPVDAINNPDEQTPMVSGKQDDQQL